MNESQKEELRFRIDKILIHHSAFESALKRIQRCYDGAIHGSDPTCLAILGESRTGKTRSLECFESKHLRFRVEDGLKVPILKIKVQSKPTVKGLVTELLHGLDDPLYNQRATENEKTHQLKCQLRNAETKLIFLDEFQHFIDQGTNKIQHHVTDWLKMVVDDTRVGLVVAGLPSAMSVISKNDQLVRRFQAPAILKRFDWRIQHDQNEFRSILFNIQKNLKEFSMPEMDSEDMALRMYVASGGLIGYVIKILREATSMAIQSENMIISLSSLSEAHNLTIMDKIDGLERPFSESFNFTPTEASIKEILSPSNLIAEKDRVLRTNTMTSAFSRADA